MSKQVRAGLVHSMGNRIKKKKNIRSETLISEIALPPDKKERI